MYDSWFQHVLAFNWFLNLLSTQGNLECCYLPATWFYNAVHVNQTSACKDLYLPFSIVALTHHGAAPKVCFHWEPSVCVHTNTVHSRHTTKIPHWSCVRVVCVKGEGMCVCVRRVKRWVCVKRVKGVQGVPVT